MSQPRPTRRRRLLVAAALGAAAVLHVVYWYAPRLRAVVPDPGDAVVAALVVAATASSAPGGNAAASPGERAAGGWGLWLPFPHQTLPALGTRLSGGRPAAELVAALAGLAGRSEPPRLRLGPFAVPPSRALAGVLDGDGSLAAGIDLYPSAAGVVRLAGALAGNPWLTGGAVQVGSGGTVRWSGLRWELDASGLGRELAAGSAVDPAVDPAVGAAPAAAPDAGLGEAVSAVPALGLLRLAEPLAGLPAGLYRLSAAADDGLLFERLDGPRPAAAPAVAGRASRSRGSAAAQNAETDAAAEAAEVDAAGGRAALRGLSDTDEVALLVLRRELVPAAVVASPTPTGAAAAEPTGAAGEAALASGASPPGPAGPTDRLLALAVWAGDGRAGLPPLVALAPAGSRADLGAWSRPLGKLDRALGRSAHGEVAGWNVAAIDAAAVARVAALTPLLDELGQQLQAPGAMVAIVRPAALARAMGSLDALLRGLGPLLPQREVERFRAARSLAAALDGVEVMTVAVAADGGARMELRLD